MTIHIDSASPPAVLKAKIQTVSLRLQHRRGRITRRVRLGLTSPTALIAAGCFGVMVHQSQTPVGLRILQILQTANAGLRLVLTAVSSPNSTAE